MPSRDLKVTLVGDDRTSGAFGSAGRNADDLTTRFGNLGRTVGLALGGIAAAGVAGLGAALVQGARDAASYEQITNQVAQTIRSTGGAAGVTADGLKDYAGQLESMSGVDEELILSGQNVLLTFTNVQNQVGEGNDIFDQASEAALNLSTTMGGDLVGANTLVGKALNDPIAGMTALRRAGVQLTEAQQDQVTAMVESGDVIGAQKVLLGELETQFGGAAAAAGEGLTGSLARAKDAFQDMFRGIATALLPTLADLAEFFTNTLMPGIKGIYDLVIGGDFTGALTDAFGWEEDSGVVDFLFNLRDAFMTVGDVVGTVFSAFSSGGEKASGSLAGIRDVVQSVVDFVGPAFQQLQQIFTTVVEIVTGLWDRFGTTILSYWSSTLDNIGTVFQGALSIVQGILDVFVGIFTGDWSRAWDGVKGIFSGAWDVITGAFQQALNFFGTIASVALGALGSLISSAWEGIKSAASSAWSSITGAVSTAWGNMTGAVSTGVSNAVEWVRGLPSRMLSALGNLGSLLLSAGTDLLHGLWQGIQDAKSWLLRKVGDFFGDLLPGWVRDILGIRSPSTVFAEMGRYLMQGMAVGIDAGAGDAVAAASAAADQVTAASRVSFGLSTSTAGSFGLGAAATASGGGGFGESSGGAFAGDAGVMAEIRDALRDLRNRPTVDIGQVVTQDNETAGELAQRLAFMARTA